MNLDLLKEEITSDEGRRKIPYRDTRGFWTGGIGHNLTAYGVTQSQIDAWRQTGIPDETIDYWYDQDVAQAIADCQKIFPSFEFLTDNRQRVLVNMAYDLKWELAEWHHLRAAVEAQDWQAAALSIMDSLFAKQAPNRCSRLAARMVEG